MRAWRELAVCAGVNGWTELPRGDRVADCDRCPVKLYCLQSALDAEAELCREAAELAGSDDPRGHLGHLVRAGLPMYGGLTIRERASLLAERMDRRKRLAELAS